jgi:aryl-alcohol dehydrogenase-like predicted oxidoreductase
MLDPLFELGCTSRDTASIYVRGIVLASDFTISSVHRPLSHQGDSEELIGKWFARTGNRDKISLATKLLYSGQVNRPRRPNFVRQTVGTSLKRL